MTCKKSGIGSRLCLAGVVFCFLFLSSWSLPAQESPGSSPEDLIYQACQEIVEAHPDMKPQIKLIASGLRQIAERQTDNSQALQTTIDGQALKIIGLQTTIDGQALKIIGLQTTIDGFPILLENSTISHVKVEDDLKRYANDLETGLALSLTVDGILGILNIIQAIAYQIK